MALLTVDAKSMLERAQEEDNIVNGKMDNSIGSLQNHEELKPENFEALQSDASITATAEAIKKRAR